MLVVGDWALGDRHCQLHLDHGLILANLEGPILPADHGISPAAKAGPHLFSTSLTSDERPFVFSLANNHTMDYGDMGLNRTLAFLNNRNVMTAGAGRNIEAARAPIIFEVDGARVGLVACCEAQFGLATLAQAGVAELGPWVYREIRNLKPRVDTLIISVHAAQEMSPWPSPRIQDQYRSFIDTGASVVHGHHSHVPQGIEEYNGGVILYGMGNFVVEPDKWRNSANALWSLGVELACGKQARFRRLLTLEIRETSDGELVIEESSQEQRICHEEYLRICDRPLQDRELLEALWQEVSIRAYFEHGAKFMGFPDASGGIESKQGVRASVAQLVRRVVRSIKRNEPVKSPTKSQYLLWHVMCNCESHRSALATALGVSSGELEDMRTDDTRRLADGMMPWSVKR